MLLNIWKLEIVRCAEKECLLFAFTGRTKQDSGLNPESRNSEILLALKLVNESCAYVFLGVIP